jgi:uncharacterized protein YdhG (YjbR/CyaY superfamily)
MYHETTVFEYSSYDLRQMPHECIEHILIRNDKPIRTLKMAQENSKKEPQNVDEYIALFPEEVQEILNTLRTIIKEKAPDAAESMAYGMPAYKTYGKPLVYFAAFPKHIGFYATPTGHEHFAHELSAYKQGKGSVQFPLDQHIPYNLVGRLVEFRVAENTAKYGKKG